MSSSATFDRVVLLGFMASGKTAVGAALADALGWRFVDLDALIVERTGRSIDEIFSAEGEAAFRRLEVEVSSLVTGERETVIAPGGGWITNPGLFDQLPPRTLTVWLKASPREILKRVESQSGGGVRPLLEDLELGRLKKIEHLLEQRVPLYSRAAKTVVTDNRRIDEIVAELKKTVLDKSMDTNGGEANG